MLYIYKVFLERIIAKYCGYKKGIFTKLNVLNKPVKTGFAGK